MKKKISVAFALLVAFGVTLIMAKPLNATAYDGASQQQKEASHVRRRASKSRKKARRAVSYACPMHPDIRSKTRGECPKCGMELVAGTH
jgi:hypothetical protein